MAKVTYRYYIFTLGSTPEFKQELPLTEVSYGVGFYTAQEFNGSIAIVPETDRLNLREYTIPGKYALYALRNGVCVFGGIVWSRSYDSSSRVLQINAMSFEAALYARIWRRTRTYAENTSQYAIARTLLNDIFTDYSGYTPQTNWTGITAGSPASGGCPGQPPGSAYTIGNCYVEPLTKAANLGITVPGVPAGVNENAPQFLTKETDGFLGHDMKVFGDMLAEFARTPREPDKVTGELQVGFEYRIDCAYDEARQTFTRTFQFGYPKIRNDKSTMDYVIFDYPGSISSFNFAETVENSAMRAWVSGSGEGNEKIAQTRYSANRYNAGYFLTERAESFTDVEQPSILYARATNVLQRQKMPVADYSFSVIGWKFPFYMTPLTEPGAWRIGDWAKFVVRDPLFHGVYGDKRGITTVTARIIGYRVTLVDDQNGDPSEVIDLELEDKVVQDAPVI